MLTAQVVDDLLKPVNEEFPCGPDLEYDPEFLALQTDAQGKPEQQFGDTVIPAVEPDWREIQTRSMALLARSKDLRPALLLLRASTRVQGVVGFQRGVQLVTQLLDAYWPTLYPHLDADDDNDPTMRLNALTPLADESTLIRDLYEARLGVAPGLGPIQVRDVLVARNALTQVSGTEPMSQAAVEGGLQEIVAVGGDAVDASRALPALIAQLGALVSDRTGLTDALDLSRLRTVAQHLQWAVGGLSAHASAAVMEGGSGEQGAASAAGAISVEGPRGEIRNRQDAIQTLNKVIHYLQQAEPGNPAPLLIERAKKLIGVSFLEIMADLAPNALDTIEVVTGKRSEE